MAGRFEIFDRPVGKNDSELDCEISFLTQAPRSSLTSLVAIVWMYPLQHSFAVGKTLQRIKTPRFGNFPLTNKQALSR